MAIGRAWEAVFASLERDLATGELRVGDHLPPERTLAADLGVGRSSVREAVRVLEVLGLVRTATGSGPSAGAIVVSKPEGAMSVLMRLQVAGRGFAVDDVVRTRLVLERGVVVELAAGSPAAGSPALAAAAELLDAMDAADGVSGAGGGAGHEEFLALDTRFHTALAEATGNQVIAAVMSGLRGAIESYVTEGAAALPDWAATSARLRTEHRAILAAVAAGDPATAATLVTDHITGYYTETRLSSAPSGAPAAATSPSAVASPAR